MAGGSGADTLVRGNGEDYLDGGEGDDIISPDGSISCDMFIFDI